MVKSSRSWFLIVLPVLLALTAVAAWMKIANSQDPGRVNGVVADQNGPIAGARVRIRATEYFTLTDHEGQFTLKGLENGREVEVTAWSDGYYIASSQVTPTVDGIALTLRPYHTEDHPEYAWTSPISGTSPGACGNCHPMIFPQWSTNAHGQAIANPRFFSLYNGTNLSGTQLVGPGFANDFPGTAGNCANCHAPGAGVDGYLTTDMNADRDVITAGIHCDFCHKVGGVYLDPASGSVYANAPGVRSQRVLRPPPGDNIFFGPYDDIHDPDTYLPLISESQFCAPCHQFSFWGTPIYESYEEWLVSSYAELGVTCQDCHMPPNGDAYFALPEVGGLAHPPEIIPSHRQLGATAVELLQNTVEMTVSAEQLSSRLQVTVVITNVAAGHHVPTDFPGRHLILVLEVTDGNGQTLTQLTGPVVPGYGGAEAGSPGVIYAKVLRDISSGDYPVVSYWKQTLIESDNRIPALGASKTRYTFSVNPSGGDVQVQARLVFRRVFQDISDQKAWDIPDILMEEASTTLSPAPVHDQYLPLIR